MKLHRLLPLATAAVLFLFLFGACGSVENQITGQVGNKIGEQIAQKAVEGATGGNVKINAGTNELNIQTPEGVMKVNKDNNQVTLQTTQGEAVFGSGDTRPGSVQDDMPNLDGAKEFSWAGSKDGGMLSFSVPGTDHKQACDQEIGLLVAKGWTLNKEVLMEFEGMTTRTLENNDYSLSLSCSADKDNNKVSVLLIKSKKTK